MPEFWVAFVLTCTAFWHRATPVTGDGQSCGRDERFEERVVYAGRGFQLRCPLGPPVPRSSPQTRMLWMKDCVLLPEGYPLRLPPSGPTQVLVPLEGVSYLSFPSLSSRDQGNYTCVLSSNTTTTSSTVHLTVKEPQCSTAPVFRPNGALTRLWGNLGSTVELNCTALLHHDAGEEPCNTSLRWSKDGHPLTNDSMYQQNSSMWAPGPGQMMLSSRLQLHLRDQGDFGLYSCTVRNTSADFSVQNSDQPSHTSAVIAAVFLLLLLVAALVVHVKCHLNIRLWYKNAHGNHEFQDGRLYDAYISYVNNEYDRKFVNFILKPHLENKHGYKLHLNNNDILPGSEPSAELLMNVSRSRRLILVLSHAYVEQDWCSFHFSQGILRLLELAQRPILITLEGQPKYMKPEIRQELREQRHRLTLLTWRHDSVTPSSAFWKELALAMPRRMLLHSEAAGDPQTVLQDDKDPMLTLDPDYLDPRADTDPAGDIGLRLPVYKALASRAPVLPTVEAKPSDIDVSDLGTRNYGARTDFYCLVTEEDV